MAFDGPRDQQIDLTLFDDPVGTITQDHFGHILINKFGAAAALDQADEIGLSFIRFPGGTIAEKALVEKGRLVIDGNAVTLDMLQGDRAAIAYDITHPDLIAPTALAAVADRPDGATLGLSAVMQHAIERGQALNLIIPVQRYFIDQDFTDPDQKQAAVDQAIADVTVFADRLVSGGFNGGNLPPQLLFDIGNEPYGNPFEYAVIAKVIIETLDTELVGSGIAYEVGFQMGRGSNTFRQLNDGGYFNRFFDGDKPLLAELQDSPHRHSSSLPFEDRVTYVDRQMMHLLGETLGRIDYVRHHHLAVDLDRLQDTSGLFHQRRTLAELWDNAISDEVDYYVSAWTTQGHTNDPFSLSGAATILEIYRNLPKRAWIGRPCGALWAPITVTTAAFRPSCQTPPAGLSHRKWRCWSFWPSTRQMQNC